MKLKVSEIFYSTQGEGRYVGVPSVFLRTFGCNFTCGGFGMPRGEVSVERDSVDSDKYKSFADLPLVHTGCDSYASWDPRFKDFSPTKDIDTLVNELLVLTPNGRWQQYTGNPVHLVITGGEPLLGWQRVYPELLEHSRMLDLDYITFETNGTQPLSPDFQNYIEKWHTTWRGTNESDHDQFVGRWREMQFSVSPKLSASGEKWEDAIRPEVVLEYQQFGYTYLKFVVASKEDFDEVQKAVGEYRQAGFMGQVYVMPVGGTTELYEKNKLFVAEEALKLGYIYSPRLHVDLWGNGWGK
jgi:organic radical activating enzyme